LGNATRKALFKPNNVISQNLPNIISAMQQSKVERLLFVSSFGVNGKIFWPEKLLLRTLFRNLFADLPVQEKLIKESGLNWTIVRPARLTNGLKTGECRSGENIYIHPFSSISRADVADFLLKVAVSPEYQRKVATISY
jgi:putative NADH-flavin reductase